MTGKSPKISRFVSQVLGGSRASVDTLVFSDVLTLLEQELGRQPSVEEITQLKVALQQQPGKNLTCGQLPDGWITEDGGD